MSGLFAELQRTTQALNAQSQGVYTAGRNLANVNNPAYARQRVILGDRGTYQTALGAQSLGLEALALQNIRDGLLDTQVIRETSSLNSVDRQADAYYKAQLALGQQVQSQDASFIEGANNGNSQSLGEALDNFFNAFSSLASSPRAAAERQVLYQRAAALINGLNTADTRLGALQNDLTAQVGVDLNRVNELLSTLRNLNEQISRFEVGHPGSALDLRDQRQARLEELSEYLAIEVETPPDSAGQIRILARDAADNPIVLLDSAKEFSDLTFDGTSIHGGRPATVLALGGGRLHGGLVARDGVIAEMRTGLDRVSAQLVVAVNTTYNPGGTATNFFDATGTTAATIRFDATLTAENIRATATTDAGANEIARAIADLATTTFSTGAGAQFNGTFGAYYRSLVSTIGNAASNAEGMLQDQTVLHRAILNRRDSVSGVSIDEEITDLTKYQRAFEASARMMRAIDEMLDLVVNRLGT
jgi:flagellar hook-associated protein 1 FlgK